MQEIPTLFIRDPKMRLAINEVNPGCEWVLAGEGVATEKLDGTACAIIQGRFYKRLRIKEGKPAPEGWLHWDQDPAMTHGHGWVPVGDGPEDAYHREAWISGEGLPDGTYELIGPKVQGDSYGLEKHVLALHGAHVLDAPRTYDALAQWLAESPPIEGIVWHHPDGRYVKIKRRDFRLPWPMKPRFSMPEATRGGADEPTS